MKLLFQKTMIIAIVTALAMAALPFASASALGANDPTPPPAGDVSKAKLEQAWARQLKAYARLGMGFEQAEDFIARVQNLIDKASENGKDVTALQAALDAFEASIEKARPLYESAGSIVKSHAGFDEKGKLIDVEKAKETVRSMGEKLKEIKAAMDGTGRALREAVKAFREANPRPKPTTTPEA